MTIAPHKLAKTLVVEYPEDDGEPMPEGDVQRQSLSYTTQALRIWFQSRQDAYISGNLFIYYTEGSPKDVIAPDTFVVFGVDKGDRGTYKIWEENYKAPDFVLEVTSKSTVKKDQRDKVALYQKLKVKEYWQYDPTGNYLQPRSLVGKTLDLEQQYQDMPWQLLNEGILSIYSTVLKLELRLYPNIGLRFYDPITQTMLRSHEEAEKALQQERLAKQQAQLIAQQEREQKHKLMDYLRSIGINPEEIYE